MDYGTPVDLPINCWGAEDETMAEDMEALDHDDEMILHATVWSDELDEEEDTIHALFDSQLDGDLLQQLADAYATKATHIGKYLTNDMIHKEFNHVRFLQDKQRELRDSLEKARGLATKDDDDFEDLMQHLENTSRWLVDSQKILDGLWFKQFESVLFETV